MFNLCKFLQRSDLLTLTSSSLNNLIFIVNEVIAYFYLKH